MNPSAVVVPPLPPLPVPFGATFPAPPAPTVIVLGPGDTVCKGALIGAGTAGSVNTEHQHHLHHLQDLI